MNPDTSALWQLIVSVLIFLVTSYAFCYAKGQWQKDNFLNLGKEIIILDK